MFISSAWFGILVINFQSHMSFVSCFLVVVAVLVVCTCLYRCLHSERKEEKAMKKKEEKDMKKKEKKEKEKEKKENKKKEKEKRRR